MVIYFRKEISNFVKDKMENFYSIYGETYLSLLPMELKELLFKYIYGPFYIEVFVGSRLNLSLKLHIPVLTNSEVVELLPINDKDDLNIYNNISISIKHRFEKLGHKIWLDNGRIQIGTGPTIQLKGNDANIFLLKLKQLYQDLTTLPYDELYLCYFYY